MRVESVRSSRAVLENNQTSRCGSGGYEAGQRSLHQFSTTLRDYRPSDISRRPPVHPRLRLTQNSKTAFLTSFYSFITIPLADLVPSGGGKMVKMSLVGKLGDSYSRARMTTELCGWF
jgi:hypothetical protein